MSFDPSDTISRLQSSTVRNALVLIVVNILTLVTVFTGKAFDIDFIKEALNTWLPLAINAASVYWGWKTYTGRIASEKTISPLPWREEIKSMKE